MKIIYMGTPEFSIPTLKKLVESRHRVLGVVTVPDKPRGRGRKLQPSPVKKFAIGAGLPVFQPEILSSPEFLEKMQDLEPDIFVVVAFRILPFELFSIPRYGAMNLHASLLPRYRGAAPINWALINGEKYTGVTTFIIEKKVDTGNILLQKKIEIDDNDDAGTLSGKLSLAGAEIVLHSLDGFEKGDLIFRTQDESLVTRAPKITSETGRINWHKSADTIRNLMRGLSPKPGAYSFLNGVMIKFFSAEIIRGNSSFPPGTIIKTGKELHVQTGEGILNILSLQSEGKKKLKAREFLAGFKGKPGDRFSHTR